MCLAIKTKEERRRMGGSQGFSVQNGIANIWLRENFAV
jgi:hypothetical protein